MCGNNQAMEIKSRELFLSCDQNEMIRKFGLEADDGYLYVRVLGGRYAVDRTDGRISGGDGVGPVDHDIAMAIYDLLTYTAGQSDCPGISGKWVTLSTLGGLVGAGHEKKLHRPELLKPFEGKVSELRKAGELLGGTPLKKGDVSFRFPVFDCLPMVFEYWDADDEFPANVQFLWDGNADRIVHFEILYYLTAYVERRLAELVEAD